MRKSLCLIVFFPLVSLGSDTLRIFCRSLDYNAPKLVTLRSDVTEAYPSADIDFRDEKNRVFKKIYSYQPWKMNGLTVEVYLIAENREGMTNLYLAQVKLAKREATSTLVAPSRYLSADQFSSVQTLGIRTSLMTVVGDSLLYPGTSANEFVLLNPNNNSQLTFKIAPNLLNPRASVSSNHLLFDYYDSKTYSVAQLAFELSNKKISFQTQAGKTNNLFMEFNPKTNSWVYLNITPETEQAKLLETNASGKTVHVSTMNTRSLKYPLSYSFSNNELSVAWAHHSNKKEVDDNGNEKIVFTDGAVTKLNLGLNIPQLEKFDYSPSLKFQVSNHFPDSTFMSSSLWVSGSEEIVFSLGTYRGLAKLNFKTGQWTLHGTLTSRCIEPEWTFEDVK